MQGFPEREQPQGNWQDSWQSSWQDSWQDYRGRSKQAPAWGLVAIALLGAGCNSIAVNPTAPAPSPDPLAIATSPVPAPAPPAEPPPDPYPQALEQAANAINLSRAAQSQDDWRLAVSRWQQAIQLLQRVPPDSPNRASAQTKLGEYRRNLAIAQQQANRGPGADASVILSAPPAPSPAPSPAANATRSSSNPAPNSPQNPARGAASAADTQPNSATAPPSANSATAANTAASFRAPIVRRAGGTPVISVTFNGGPAFDMILDTGASGTLITQRMATVLNLRPTGQTTASTANARNVTFPLSAVESMEAGGLVARNVPVAIAGPELNIGLLGNDFFGSYDVVIRQNEVEFRAR
ncbi:MAG: hypothetical protein Fur0046_25210 [Cyanobacteria bacterium J069]